MDNPYQSSFGSTDFRSERTESLSKQLDFSISWSQVGIWIILLILGGVSLLSVVGFLFNLTTTWPGTNQPTLVANPAWMIGHLVRASTTGYIALLLFSYACRISAVSEGTDSCLIDFMDLHMKVWFRAAIAFLVLFLYAFLLSPLLTH